MLKAEADEGPAEADEGPAVDVGRSIANDSMLKTAFSSAKREHILTNNTDIILLVHVRSSNVNVELFYI